MTQRSPLARFFLAFFGKTFATGLVWPAAAGNVFWSFLTILVDRDNPNFAVEWWPRIVMLLILSGYLAFDWQNEQYDLKRRPEIEHSIGYWAFDYVHILPIAAVAIMATTNASASDLSRVLMGLFTVTIIGHLLGAWETSWGYRLSKAAANLAGLALLFLVPFVAWRPVVALGTALAIWGVIEGVAYRKRTRKA